MKRPSKSVLSKLNTLFPGFTIEELPVSPNSLPFKITKGDQKYFIKIIEAHEGLEGIEEKLQGLECENLVNLIESGDLEGDFGYLKFEHLEGVNLDELSQPLSETELKKLALAIANAINTLWKNGLVHRDVKPKNILKITTTGDFKLVDLGIGYYAEAPFRDNSRSRSNGSRFYSSPEQFESNQDDRTEITFASDQFSLGVILFELATGTHPYKDFDTIKYNNYGAAVSLMEPPKVETLRGDLSPEFTAVINKMLQTEASDRYRSTKKLIEAITGTVIEESPAPIQIYIQDTDDGAGYKRLDNYKAATASDHLPNGVMVTTSSGSQDRIKTLKLLGFEVIVDPMTCRLPYKDAKVSSIKTKLGLNTRKVYSPSQLPANLDKIIDGTIAWQKDATSIVLPYFAIRDSNDDFFQLNKQIWRQGKSLVTEASDQAKKVYGGISIPVDILVDAKVRKSMLSHLLAKFNIDGMFVVFENNKKPIKTLDDKDILEGMKEVLNMLYEIGDVIVARADMSLLPLMRGGIFVTSFSDSRRRFSFKDQFDSPSPGGGGNADRKLKYYCDPIFTFLEEKTLLTGLGSNASLLTELECSCIHCNVLKPFTPGVAVDHQLAENHFYYKVTEIRNNLNAAVTKPEKDAYLREKLTEAIRVSERVKNEAFLRGQEISDHVSLLGLIDY